MNNAISAALALTPLVLAQSPSIGATELGQWLLAGAAAAVIANQGMAFFKNIMGGFARKQTSRNESTPSMEECKEKHAGLATELKAMRDEWKVDRKNLHDRINPLAENIKYIRGRIEGMRDL